MIYGGVLAYRSSMMHARARATVVLAALVALIAAACAGGDALPPAAEVDADASSAAPASSPAADSGAPSPAQEPSNVERDFPTGPAVTVPVGYEPPRDHVPSTGAYLPANGRPTLVYVDAIW
jgi:hypothetical protein